MAFQDRHSGIDARWERLVPHLPQRPSWGLDIGSNLGDTAFRAAALGHTMVGIETNRKLVIRATAAAPKNVGFMVGEVDPASLSAMPHFDFIFMLSVLHRIWAVGGQACAEECFRASLEKTDTILFEGSMRHARYTDCGQPAPDFESNSLDAAVSWHLNWLNGLATPKGWSVKHLGSVPCSQKEPFRPLFLLEHSGRVSLRNTTGGSAGSARNSSSREPSRPKPGVRLRNRLAVLKARLLPSRVCYRGSVFSGAKRGTRVIPRHGGQLRELTGMTLVPGTLNVKLEKELALAAPVTFRAWRNGQTLTPALMNGVRVFLYRWPKCKPTRVEIVSDVNLRSHLSLRDGDVVSIYIDRQFVRRG